MENQDNNIQELDVQEETDVQKNESEEIRDPENDNEYRARSSHYRTKRKSSEKDRKKRIIYLSCLILFILILAGSAIGIINYYSDTWQIRQGQNELDELLERFPTFTPPSFFTPAPAPTSDVPDDYTPGASTPEPTEPPIFEPYEEILKINRDFVGWIRVDNADVNYPIMQTTNNEYYLTHTYKRQNNTRGSIYMDYRNNKNLQDRLTIIYGHNPHDGTMLHTFVDKYKDYNFWKNNRYIYINSLNHQYIYEVFCAMVVNVEDQDADDYFYYLYTNLPSDEDFLNFIAACNSRSMYQTDLEITPNDKIVTISTCTYEGGYYGKYRFVVMCKMVGSD